jgi:sugar lactone lactonase YvrE
MTTYVGTPQGFGFAGDGGPALSAVFSYPGALVTDGSNLFVADTLNFRIRRIDGTTGNVATVAGTGTCCGSGDGGPATKAKINVFGMSIDGNGGIFFTDDLGVRYIARDGTISRISGGSTVGFSGDDASATSATQYNGPIGVAFASTGEVIIADTGNSRIRKLQPNDPTKMDILSGSNQKGVPGRPDSRRLEFR